MSENVQTETLVSDHNRSGCNHGCQQSGGIIVTVRYVDRFRFQISLHLLQKRFFVYCGRFTVGGEGIFKHDVECFARNGNKVLSKPLHQFHLFFVHVSPMFLDVTNNGWDGVQQTLHVAETDVSGFYDGDSGIHPSPQEKECAHICERAPAQKWISQ